MFFLVLFLQICSLSEKKNRYNNSGEDIKKKAFLISAKQNWIPYSQKFRRIYRGFYVINEVDHYEINKLKDDSSILMIDELKPIQFSTRFSGGFVDTGNQFLSFENGFLVSPRLFNKVGLNGDGEIVGLTDSGIDYLNCWFNDPEVPLIPGVINMTHRKIVHYSPWKDKYDYSPGHGTHTAAILAGKANSNFVSSQYNGIAPEAKLYFLDIGNTNQPAVLYDDFNKESFISMLRSFGGGIVSNSWGTLEEYPHSMTFLYDTIAVENPDILWLFAAGNHYGLKKIDTPSSSKNVLCIGASENTAGSSVETSNDLVVECDGISVSVFQTLWSLGLWKEMQKETFPLYNQSKNVFGFINQTNDHCEQVSRLINLGKRVIFIKGKNHAECLNFFNQPVLEVESNEFEKIQTCESFSLFPNVEGYPKTLSRASFSSGGPSINGLLKPDIISIGIVQGPSSLGTSIEQRSCNTSIIQTFQGTSESTPIVAGAATIIRQYFRQGFYPNGVKNSGSSMIPSSTLLRAMLINSAQYIGGASPSFDTGFGQIQLNKVLFVKGCEQCSKLLVKDNLYITQNKHFICNFTIEYEGVFSVTLSWLDPPVSLDHHYPLHADIDIALTTPTGIKFGNNKPKDYHDYYTNNKKVIFEATPGSYQLHILSNSFDSNISCAVAMNGRFSTEEIVFEESETCISDCDCFKGKCICPEGKTGENCQVSIYNINKGSKMRPFINSRATEFYKMSIDLCTNCSFRVILTSTSSVGLHMLFYIDSIKSPNYADFSLNFNEIGAHIYDFSTNDIPSLQYNSTIYCMLYATTSIMGKLNIQWDIYDPSIPPPSQSHPPETTPPRTYAPPRTPFPTIPKTAAQTENGENESLYKTFSFITPSISILIICAMCYCFVKKPHIENQTESLQMNMI